MKNRRGLALPLKNTNGGYFASKSEEDLMWTSICLIAGTAKGERVMRPEVAADLRSLVFETIDSEGALLSELEDLLRDSVERFDPSIEILSVAAAQGTGQDEYTVFITVEFKRSGRSADEVYRRTLEIEAA